MVTEKLKELDAARAKLASLEQSIADELITELAALPAKYGFTTTSSFLAAVRAATGGRVTRRDMSKVAKGGKGKKSKKSKKSTKAKDKKAARKGKDMGKVATGCKGKVAKGGKGKRRSRAVITDETRAQVKKMVNDGKTGSQIAAELGISLPSVQNIKKAAGLVKKR